MRLMLTTAIAGAMFATGAMAAGDTNAADVESSRGNANVSGPEAVQMDTEVDATANAELDKSSRGNEDISAQEAEENPLIVDDEVDGPKLSTDDSSRGDNNLTGPEVTAEDNDPSMKRDADDS